MEVEVTFGAGSYAFQHWIQSQPGNWSQDLNFENIVFTSEQYPKYAYMVVFGLSRLEEIVTSTDAPKILGIRYFSGLPNTRKNMKMFNESINELNERVNELKLSDYAVLAIELPEGTFVPGLDSCLGIAIGCTDDYLADSELLQFTTQWDALKVSAKKLVKMTKKKYSAYDTLEDAFIKEDGTVTFLTSY